MPIGSRKKDLGNSPVGVEAAIAVLLIVIALLQASPLFGAPPEEVGFKILHTADGWGELSPCG